MRFQADLLPSFYGHQKWDAAGADFDELCACSSDQLFKRKTTVKGVRSAEAPIKPEKPRL